MHADYFGLETWQITGDGFHFGEHGLGQEATAIAMPSDSLFAALVARLAVAQGSQQVAEFVAPFLRQEPPFVLSSTFPFAGPVRFFPAPAGGARSGQQAESSAKALKKIRYVSEAVFRRLLAGANLADLFSTCLRLQDGQILVESAESQQLPEAVRRGEMLVWHKERRPRVTLGRSVQNSSIFFTGRVSYAPGCGLWFAARWLRETQPLRAWLARLLEDLEDAGLGAERNAGFGACKIQASAPLDLPDANGGTWISLSRYLPRPEEAQALYHPNASYTVRRVGGWLDSATRRGQRRRPVNLLAEGAVLGPVVSPVPGQVADVRPVYASDPDPQGHPVYRCGLALAVGWERRPA
jgi:CRISPR-associated protein Csm4